MKLSYRNQKNAEAISRYWNKPLDRPDWYKVSAESGDQAEIFVYDIIGWPFNDAGELIRMISDMKGSPILVRVNSPGGDVFDANALYNAFKAHDAKVTMRIEALAASAASYLVLAGTEVQAYRNAMMMIHEPWTIALGNQYDFREIADVLGQISGNMVDIYAAESKIGKREVREMMKSETWMTAKQMKEKGFVDTIIDGDAAKAQFDLSMFANLPPEIVPNDDPRPEPTIRDAERALRDVGFSQNKAKAMLAGSKQTDADREETETLKAVICELQIKTTLHETISSMRR